MFNEKVKRHILNAIVSANTTGKYIRYEMVQKDVQKCLNREISLRAQFSVVGKRNVE